MAFLHPPALNVVQPTPPRNNKQHHRLLYRGSLSLPDSDLVLDGIAFTAHLPPSSTSLLESPLALALESMRGRPSLRFISVVKMAQIDYECSGDIAMYIHPRSMIARTFFEHLLCAENVGENNRTKNAVRIGLGDGHGPDESDLLVFGTLLPSQSTLRMTVARVTPPRPLAPRQRKPRPDDPAPRLPPVFEIPKRIPSNKRRRSGQDVDSTEERPGKRGKPAQVIDLKALMARDTMFKVPNLIAKGKSKGRNGQGASFKLPGLPKDVNCDEDVFGTTNVISRSSESTDLETSNKMTVKKAAVKALAAHGMPKEHPEFKELYSWVTRGVGFALRRKMKTVKVGCDETERLVDSHVLLYFDGFGGPSIKT